MSLRQVSASQLLDSQDSEQVVQDGLAEFHQSGTDGIEAEFHQSGTDGIESTESLKRPFEDRLRPGPFPYGIESTESLKRDFLEHDLNTDFSKWNCTALRCKLAQMGVVAGKRTLKPELVARINAVVGAWHEVLISTPQPTPKPRRQWKLRATCDKCRTFLESCTCTTAEPAAEEPDDVAAAVPWQAEELDSVAAAEPDSVAAPAAEEPDTVPAAELTATAEPRDVALQWIDMTAETQPMRPNLANGKVIGPPVLRHQAKILEVGVDDSLPTKILIMDVPDSP